MSDPRKALPTVWLDAYRQHRNLTADARTSARQQERAIKQEINTQGLTRGAC